MENDDIIYHYCGTEAFLSIIRNSSLWLSDILKSNDKSEYSWIKAKLINAVDSELEQAGGIAFQAWKTWSKLGSFDFGIMTIHAICFSQCMDSLSQWRGYAQDGQGLAIGFSKSAIRGIDSDSENPYTPLNFGEVIYDEEGQEAFISAAKGKIFEKFQHKGIGHVALETDSDFWKQFPLYKNPSFAEEKEWRLIMLSSIINNRKIEMEGISFSEHLYRATSEKIVPYIAMDFSKIKQSLIKEIWIGPKSKVSTTDVMNILATYGYYCKEDGYSVDKPISIRHSASSYC